MRFSFLRNILFISAMLALALVYPVSGWLQPEHLRAVIASGIIALGNILLGWASLEYAIDKPNSRFMTSVFGGMGVRMVLILVAFSILLVNGYQSVALALSLMAFYVMFMIAEIVYVMKELSRRKVAAQKRSTPQSQSIVPRTLIIERAKQ
jgi:hypothetical protein